MKKLTISKKELTANEIDVMLGFTKPTITLNKLGDKIEIMYPDNIILTLGQKTSIKNLLSRRYFAPTELDVVEE